jgi:hypothetical protein
MTKAEKENILKKATMLFAEKIAVPHRANIEKCADPEEFSINPFLQGYLAKLLCGDTTPRSVAMSLIYPRVLGTSITTTFGNQIQYFCSEVLDGYGSRIPGLDLEFIDSVDKRRRYCQLKAGPNNLNKDDVEPMVAKFRSIINLGRTNRSTPLAFQDLVVAIAYGTEDQLNQNFRVLREKHHLTVLVGYDFWYRLTGDKNFYRDLTLAFARAAEELDTEGLIEKTVNALAKRLAK